MTTKRLMTIIIILALTIVISYGLPRPKYQSPDMLSKLDIPYRTDGWNGKNVEGEINPKDLRYNFINKVFTRAYVNHYQQRLLWLILDAGNFHNPKVCFGSSGFKITELPDPEFKVPGRAFKAQALYFKKGGEGLVVIYWICINKKLADWTQQKFIQLWYSLFNKEKIGLMVRFDIPAIPEDPGIAIKLAQEFISDIYPKIAPDQAEYIFGK